MPTTNKQARGLSDTDLMEILGLIKDADSVELKLTVPEQQQRSTVTALGIDPLDAQIRQVYFFDTPELSCNSKGVVVRARRVQRRGDDSVIKLRPVIPAQLSSGLRKSKNLGVEVDAMPGGYVCSASFKGTLGTTEVKQTVHGEGTIRGLFSKQQRAFFDEHAPTGVALDDLSVLGPITVLKLKLPPGEFGRRLVCELWFYPDGSRILELSTKCVPAEAFQVAAESRAFLASRGIDLSGQQQTKTATALRYFSRGLAEAGKA